MNRTFHTGAKTSVVKSSYGYTLCNGGSGILEDLFTFWLIWFTNQGALYKLPMSIVRC